LFSGTLFTPPRFQQHHRENSFFLFSIATSIATLLQHTGRIVGYYNIANKFWGVILSVAFDGDALASVFLCLLPIAFQLIQHTPAAATSLILFCALFHFVVLSAGSYKGDNMLASTKISFQIRRGNRDEASEENGLDSDLHDVENE
jgi:hypothetical protein